MLLTGEILFKHDKRLTKRQRDCLYWAAHDKTMKETARILNISPDTVNQHRREIMRKLQCRTITGALLVALQLGLMEQM